MAKANASGPYTPTSITLPNFKKCLFPLQNFSYFRSGFRFPNNIICSSSIQQQGSHKMSPIVSRVGNSGCKLVGCGSALPSLKISNDDLAQFVETNDEWISVRTGIRNRRVLSVSLFRICCQDIKKSTHMFNLNIFRQISVVVDWWGQYITMTIQRKDSLVSLAAEAAQKALQMAGVDADDVDLVLLCTSTPEDLFGSAPQIQKALGCKGNPLSYDITAACSGFMLGLVAAASHVRGSGFKNVLVIGADALSRYVDWSDRGTCILFGDGAGAVLVQACDSEEDGLFSFDLHSDGDGQRHLNASIKDSESGDAASSNGSVHGFPPKGSVYSCIQMNGKEVFRFAARVVPQSIEYSLKKAGLTASSIDWLLLHQANQRILDAVATRLEVPAERVISNLANYGNTSAASIPLALDEAVRSGKVQSGHLIAAAGFGAGLTWGSAILRWK
ncbi:hypothetical protein Leryth_026201 [Lithospermum erythrorhizon]|nr:hypothetical protein Leryth_026201 [Lithospermum erythrorhizon]